MTIVQLIIDFLASYKFVILFYVVLAIIVFINRKKFSLESGFILLYKTKWGINFIDRVAEKHKKFIQILGYSAIGIGFVGMIVICGFLLKGLYELFFVPSAPPTVSLVIPGVQIPGSPIFVPFWYGIIALFFVVVFHEFGHGIVARSHGVKIKSTGIVFFGPIIGAFVEPDEKKMTRYTSSIQQSVFASGPFFNGILAVLVLLLLTAILNPLLSAMVTPNGFTFTNLQDKYPAKMSGLRPGAVYNYLNGEEINTTDQLVNALSCVAPNQTITIGNFTANYTIVTAASPTDPSKGYLGVSGINTNFELKSHTTLFTVAYYIVYFLVNLLEWVFILSLGIGLANLLPLGPVDGGRMIYTALTDIYGKRGAKIWIAITMIVIAILIVLIVVPIVKSIFSSI